MSSKYWRKSTLTFSAKNKIFKWVYSRKINKLIKEKIKMNKLLINTTKL